MSRLQHKSDTVIVFNRSIDEVNELIKYVVEDT